jgi:hypothetical protein
MNQSCDAEIESSIHMFLCPCCIHKLYHCLNMDPVLSRERYEGLARAATQLGLHDDAALVAQISRL